MIVSLVAVLLIGALAWAGAAAGHVTLLGVVLPVFASAVFLVGMVMRVIGWAKSPVPFAIPTTGGQEKSLSWIRPNRLDAPMSTAAVIGRVLLEVVLFRSLFRNTSTEVRVGGAVHVSAKWLWLFSLLFHYSYLIIFLRHFRFFVEPVPAFLGWVEALDGLMQIGVPRLFMTDVLIVVALAFLLLRRLFSSKLRTISLPNDYFPLFLLLGIAATGICMRYFDKVDVAQAKVFIMGLLSFSPQSAEGLTPIFFTHLTLVSVLFLIFPFSKLMHVGGPFLSPTRNMRCNTREVRHVNPWNDPHAPYHTYEEYENDFRDVMAEAGLPLDRKA